MVLGAFFPTRIDTNTSTISVLLVYKPINNTSTLQYIYIYMYIHNYNSDISFPINPRLEIFVGNSLFGEGNSEVE